MRQCVCLMKVLKSTFSYLLNGYNQRCHGYSGKQMGDADWLSGVFLDSLNLAKKLYTANELMFAENCEFHACRKREI